MNTCIKKLEANQYIGKVENHTISEGQLALTHLGRIEIDSKVRMAYIKAYTDSSPMGLLNEIIGYTIGHYSGLPQPEAGIIQIDCDHLKSIFPEKDISGNKENKKTCFVSFDIGKESSSIIYSSEDGLNKLKKSLLNWSSYPLMVAFDTWVANRDRNTGNLILTGKDSYAVIDHGEILGGSSWSASTFEAYNARHLNKMVDCLFDKDWSLLPLPTKSAIAKSAENFNPVYLQLASELKYWLGGQNMNASCTAADSFISKRSEITGQLVKGYMRMVI